MELPTIPSTNINNPNYSRNSPNTMIEIRLSRLATLSTPHLSSPKNPTLLLSYPKMGTTTAESEISNTAKCP